MASFAYFLPRNVEQNLGLEKSIQVAVSYDVDPGIKNAARLGEFAPKASNRQYAVSMVSSNPSPVF